MPRSHHPLSESCWNALAVLVATGLVLAAVVTAELSLPREHTVMALLVAVPAFGALWSARGRCSWLVGGATLACTIPLSVQQWPYAPLVALTVPFGVVLATCLIGAAASRRGRADDTTADLMLIVETMQRAVLRPLPPSVGRVRARVRYLPAAGSVQVGGDLYDVLETPFGVRVIVGDVAGKGLMAVEKTVDVLGAFRELACHEPTLPGVAMRLDAFLTARDPEHAFVTALLLEIPADGGRIDLVCCGHPPPLVLSAKGAIFAEALSASPPLGLLRMTDDLCVASSITLADGDQLLLYTDGVTECRDAAGAFYPLAERAAALAYSDPADFLDLLTDDLVAHGKGRRQDDAALLLMEVATVRAAAEVPR